MEKLFFIGVNSLLFILKGPAVLLFFRDFISVSISLGVEGLTKKEFSVCCLR